MGDYLREMGLTERDWEYVKIVNSRMIEVDKDKNRTDFVTAILASEENSYVKEAVINLRFVIKFEILCLFLDLRWCNFCREVSILDFLNHRE